MSGYSARTRGSPTPRRAPASYAGCRLDPHSRARTSRGHVAEPVPEPFPILAQPVDVVDVLVALGRVLGVLERAVRPVLEPLRVLAQPRVVGDIWIAKSSATSIPCFRAVAISASNSFSVPSSGWIAS